MEQNKELRLAWDFVEHTGTSIFLTGKAGTGKTTFLKAVKEHSSKRMIVVAPTGVAAINAGGVTIHSFFQLPFSPYIPGMTIRDRFDFSKEKRRIIRTLDMVVIDEISMVRSDLLDAIDAVLRRYRESTKPFGGVQLLMIGDLQQLTPVVTTQDEQMLSQHYDTPYFFGSKALQQISYVTIQLTHVYRQQDQAFINILNHIRDGKPTPQDIVQLNARYHPSFVPKAEDGYIRLTTHNRMADSYNETELGKLPGRRYEYTAEVEGDFPEYSYPADVKLELKLGAQVMFIKNDTSGSHRYYNGLIGHVVNIGENNIEVRPTGSAESIKVEKQEWENTKYVINQQSKVIEPQVQGVFRHYPLRLAWAITIHKSQGLTFERAIIDAGLSFASGQVYVALSRCKSLDGLVLASPINQRSIINDHRVADYIANQEVAAERSIERLPSLKEEYFRAQLLDLFDFTALYQAEQLVHRTLQEFFRGAQSLTNLHAQTIIDFKARVIDVAYKWQATIRATSIGGLHENDFLDRVKRSAGYFVGEVERLLRDAIEKTKMAKSNNTRGMTQMEERFKELWTLYLAKDRLLRRMEEETFDVPVYMLAKQESMLDALDVVSPGNRPSRPRRRKTADGDSPFDAPRRRTATNSNAPMDGSRARNGEPERERKPKPQKGETYAISYNMFLQGKTPQQIAEERNLSPTTIYGHLARFVKEGKLAADKVIDPGKVRIIRQALAQLADKPNGEKVKAISKDGIEPFEVYFVIQSK